MQTRSSSIYTSVFLLLASTSLAFSYSYTTYEGDMLHLKGDKPSGTGTIWKDAVVHFQISEMFSQKQLNDIIFAMAAIEAHTCIRFNNSRSGSFVNILPSDRCASFIGNIGHSEGQTLFLGQYSCFKRRDILHQLLHVLGFPHEHNRIDRDDHIIVHTDNIKEGRLPYFKKASVRDSRTMNWPYSFETVMHAKQNEFAINKHLPTIEVKDNFTGTMGGEDGLTSVDIERINSLYQCSEQPLKPKFTDAYRPGFVGGVCTDEGARYLSDPTNCLHYLECVDGRYLSRACPTGTSYYAKELLCGVTDMTKCG